MQKFQILLTCWRLILTAKWMKYPPNVLRDMTWTTKRKHAELKNWINKSSVFNLGTERRKLQEQYQGQVDTLIHTWEGEIEKCKEMEEKLANTFRTQQKFYTGLRINQVSQCHHHVIIQCGYQISQPEVLELIISKFVLIPYGVYRYDCIILGQALYKFSCRWKY